ncbi:MAG: DUF4328 domain-containing protein [Myxococcota bacterium]
MQSPIRRASAAIHSYHFLVAGFIAMTLTQLALLAAALDVPAAPTVEAIEAATVPIVLLSVGSAIATVVTVLRWQALVHRNLWNANVTGLRRSVSWGLWSWFIPFANLAVPFAVYREIWKSSQQLEPRVHRTTTGVPTSLVTNWQALFILGTFLDRAASLFDEGTTDLLVSTSVGSFSFVVGIGAAMMGIRVVRSITDMQLRAPALSGQTVTRWSPSMRFAFGAGALTVALSVALAWSVDTFLPPDRPAEPLVHHVVPHRRPATSLPTLVWLHGYGDWPSLVEDEYFQIVADVLGVAFIEVAATYQYSGVDEREWTPQLGYEWAEETEVDGPRVWQAIRERSLELALDPSRIALFGFSQGAKVAAMLSSQRSGPYRGAIVMSPGGLYDTSLDPDASGLRRKYIITVNQDEAPGNLEDASALARGLEEIGGDVSYREVEGVSTHSFPPDFDERFIEWTIQILELDVDPDRAKRRIFAALRNASKEAELESGSAAGS